MFSSATQINNHVSQGVLYYSKSFYNVQPNAVESRLSRKISTDKVITETNFFICFIIMTNGKLSNEENNSRKNTYIERERERETEEIMKWEERSVIKKVG